jgi:hypothetical protein
MAYRQPQTLGAKLIVSPDEALRIVCRNDPGPLSLPFTTVMVVACTGIATAYSSRTPSANVARLIAPFLSFCIAVGKEKAAQSAST